MLKFNNLFKSSVLEMLRECEREINGDTCDGFLVQSEFDEYGKETWNHGNFYGQM